MNYKKYEKTMKERTHEGIDLKIELTKERLALAEALVVETEKTYQSPFKKCYFLRSIVSIEKYILLDTILQKLYPNGYKLYIGEVYYGNCDLVNFYIEAFDVTVTKREIERYFIENDDTDIYIDKYIAKAYEAKYDDLRRMGCLDYLLEKFSQKI